MRVSMPLQKSELAGLLEPPSAGGLLHSQSSSQYSTALHEALRTKKRSQAIAQNAQYRLQE